MSLTIERISKTYQNGVKALDQLSLDIPAGMFGLLGPNGAGKSSLMRTIATLQQADSGSISFNELNVMQNPMKLRQQLGYLPQDFGVYEGETAESLLDYMALLKGITNKKVRKQRVHEALQVTNLEAVKGNKVSKYSGGMKRRFGIAQLLLNDPRLIIVDEPTAGLDPAERTRFLNVLRGLSAQNTVIFSTHIVEDVKELCQRLAIIDKGRVLVTGTTHDLLQQLGGRIWTANISPETLHEFERSRRVLSSFYESDQELCIRIHSDQPPAKGPDQLTEWMPAIPTLSDVYFNTLKKDA